MYLLINYPDLHPSPRLRWIKQLAPFNLETLTQDTISVCIAIPPARRLDDKSSYRLPGAERSFASKHWRRRSDQIRRFIHFHNLRMLRDQQNASARRAGDLRGYSQNLLQ